MSFTAATQRHLLSNGLTVLAQREASAPVVAVVTHVKAGYFDEPDEWVGIAHVLEHMFFKGTARRGRGDIARETQMLGGYLNAGTIYDKTVYYTVLPSGGRGLAQALDIQADALMHAALDGDELARELEVIIQEAKRKLDSPSAVTAETLYELLFTTHRMRRWRIGTEAGLRKLTAQDVRQYYTTRYAPGRVVVALVGDLDPSGAVELARQTYGSWERPTVAVEGSPSEPHWKNPSVRVLSGDVMRPLATVGWRTAGTLHEDAPALDLAALVVGAGRGSRLYQAVRLPGLASSATASHYTPTEVGVFGVALAGTEERLDEAVTRSMEVVVELIQNGPSEAELERARALTAMQWARQFESMDGRAAGLCEAEALGGYALADELYRRALAVSAADVKRVAAEYLDPALASAVFYLPEGGRTTLAGDSWPLSPGRMPSAARLAVSRPTEGQIERGEPATHAAEYEGGITRRSYRGVDMLVRSKRGAGLVSIGLHVPGVPGHETSENAGLSRLLVRSTLRGAAGMDSEELAQAAELLGGSISVSTSVDGVGWGMSVRPDAVPEAARLLRLVTLEPTLADEGVAVERGLQANDARRLRDDMYRYPLERVRAQAYPADHYGLPSLGEAEVVESLSGATVRAWSERLRLHRAVVVAVGDLDAEEMLDALAPLACWPARPVRDSRPGGAPTFDCGEDSEQRDKTQTAVAMAFPAAPGASSERHALTVIGTLLSGLAGRLFDELREKRSLAYAVAAAPWLRQRAGLIVSYIGTSPEREGEAREGMLQEFDRICKEAVAEHELRRARNYAAGSVEVRQQSAAAVGSEILVSWTHGTMDELSQTAELLRAVTAEEVTAVAGRVFGSGARAEYVVRGTGKGR